MVGGIFLLNDKGHLVEMTEEAYDSEDVLQRLLATHPSLLAGDQINPSAPRRWLLITREMSIASDEDGGGRWAVDHLFLDQDAVPTLVEVKRSNDTRIRREVIGQLLEYAANAVSYWSPEKIQATFEVNCQASERDPADVLDDFLDGGERAGDFWDQVKTNLQAEKVRLVFLADAIPQELRQIVEFLNSQMDPAEVLALEVRQYAGGGMKTLVPRLFGQTAYAQQKKSGRFRDRRKWDETGFFEALETRFGPNATGIAREILDWAQQAGCKVWWGQGGNMGSFSPRIIHKGRKFQLFAVWTYGKISIYFDALQNKPVFDQETKRLELLDKLNAVETIAIPQDAITRQPSIDLSALEQKNHLKAFFDVFDWALAEIRTS